MNEVTGYIIVFENEIGFKGTDKYVDVDCENTTSDINNAHIFSYKKWAVEWISKNNPQKERGFTNPKIKSVQRNIKIITEYKYV